MIEISLARLICGIVAILFGGFAMGMSVCGLMSSRNSKNKSDNSDDNSEDGDRK